MQGFSSEQPDSPTHVCTNYGFDWQVPPLGSDFQARGCQATCESQVSEVEACYCAQRDQVACLAGQWGQTVFYNRQQSAQAICPDGLAFTYTIPAGRFAGLSQAEADAIAASQASELAQKHLICLSNLPSTLTFMQFYSLTIEASGVFVDVLPATWQLVVGGVPGMTLVFTNGPVISFTGAPTFEGTFTMVISVTLSNGDFMQKIYVITVVPPPLGPIPPNALLDADGVPILDSNGEYILIDF